MPGRRGTRPPCERPNTGSFASGRAPQGFRANTDAEKGFTRPSRHRLRSRPDTPDRPRDDGADSLPYARSTHASPASVRPHRASPVPHAHAAGLRPRPIRAIYAAHRYAYKRVHRADARFRSISSTPRSPGCMRLRDGDIGRHVEMPAGDTHIMPVTRRTIPGAKKHPAHLTRNIGSDIAVAHADASKRTGRLGPPSRLPVRLLASAHTMPSRPSRLRAKDTGDIGSDEMASVPHSQTMFANKTMRRHDAHGNTHRTPVGAKPSAPDASARGARHTRTRRAPQRSACPHDVYETCIRRMRNSHGTEYETQNNSGAPIRRRKPPQRTMTASRLSAGTPLPTHVRQLPNATTAHRMYMHIYANTGDASHRRRTSSATREQRAKANRRYAKPTRPVPNACGPEGKLPSHIAITVKSEIYIYGKIRNINERSSRSTGDGNAKPGSLRRRHESMPAHRANRLNRKEALP